MYKSNYNFSEANSRHKKLETLDSMYSSAETPKTVQIPYKVRGRHIYIIGKTQYGKTTLLYSIISQDIENGAGVCVLDPKPSTTEKPNLVDTVLSHIPEKRKDDVIYISAAKPIPLDVMSWQNEQERQTLLADLMITFMQGMTLQPDSRWPGILRHTIMTLLHAKDCNFLDIHNFLLDPSFREKILLRIKLPDQSEVAEHHAVKYIFDYWRTVFPRFEAKAVDPIIHRLSTFLLVPPISTLLGPSERGLKIEDVILGRKVLLVNLTGAGEETANFIGTLLVSRIQQAIFRQLDRYFHLFADEFQNFQTSRFEKILSEAGQLGLRLHVSEPISRPDREHADPESDLRKRLHLFRPQYRECRYQRF